MELLEETFEMYMKKTITPEFARDLSTALLVTNISEYYNLIESNDKNKPIQKLYTMTIDVLLQIYEDTDYGQLMTYEDAEKQLMTTYQCQYVMQQLKQSDNSKFNNLELTGVILWSNTELSIIRNMIQKAARFRGIRTSVLLRNMFKSLEVELRNLWKEISRLRMIRKTIMTDNNTDETYYLAEDMRYWNTSQGRKIQLRANICVGLLKDLTKTAEIAPDLIIRNSITIHWAKIMWQLRPFLKYATFVASDALFDGETLSLLINTFRCNGFRDLPYLLALIKILIEERQNWDFVNAIQLSSQFRLLSVERELKYKFVECCVK